MDLVDAIRKFGRLKGNLVTHEIKNKQTNRQLFEEEKENGRRESKESEI